MGGGDAWEAGRVETELWETGVGDAERLEDGLLERLVVCATRGHCVAHCVAPPTTPQTPAAQRRGRQGIARDTQGIVEGFPWVRVAMLRRRVKGCLSSRGRIPGVMARRLRRLAAPL